MPEKKWYKIAPSKEELFEPPNDKTEVTIEGKTICVISINETLYACAAKCPHAGGRLMYGKTDLAGNIVCPVHHYRFNLKNGFNTSGEGYFLTTWRIAEKEDGIYILL
ncbi:MAG: Rieske 2Fe-2S domain-containing protein [Chitinophagaceae bacterium]|nr:Rieske 2Fe-2S domain-containing protein [Chitinophagaceae bacterium]MBP8764626.1 Rieske 2Fe-2S domain-containing protein [Ferruginibacter sp.]MBK8929593.1 Rieske 2Fe-2S domain-containing protein [Chitinophagaceae bacterium]MBL0254083.1 Rieske 2Fe-2S domain-containing protein [Chitinophagaceae bacterium]HPA22256.1 Rieske 2Fe-2S domain-containing protein [Ferruginibacter sp.]